VQRLSFIGMLLDDRGVPVTGTEGAIDLALKDESMARLKNDGINASMTLGALPGHYRVRVVVEEAGGKMAGPGPRGGHHVVKPL